MANDDHTVDISSSRWTVAQAQTALQHAATRLLAISDNLAALHSSLCSPGDFDDRLEGRKPYDQVTDILGTIECVQADCLHPAITALECSSRITDAELEQDFRLRRQPRT